MYNRPSSIEISTEEYLKVFGTKKESKNSFYNLGAGQWEHPCWTNIDLPPQKPEFAAIQSPCIHHDFVKETKLPIDSNKVEAFYSSHVVEHIPDIANNNLFKEVYRCLKKGGVFRISTGPCADMDWEAVMRKDRFWWYFYNDSDFQKTLLKQPKPMTIYDKWLFHVATAKSIFSSTESEKKYNSDEIEALIFDSKGDKENLLNDLTKDLIFDISYPGNHVSWWNYSKLERQLSLAGFKDIYLSGYGQSKALWMRDLRYFDQTYPQISVYVEARKL
tara:strand:- start:508 stop:1332 length:825 start_codon:yes stop_codon:yes gene_type:complete